MARENNELYNIISKFAESGWDLIDEPSKLWLQEYENDELSEDVITQLISSIETADEQCGSCGCEFDPLYKKALVLLDQ